VKFSSHLERFDEICVTAGTESPTKQETKVRLLLLAASALPMLAA
jgi:hypothetical protein